MKIIIIASFLFLSANISAQKMYKSKNDIITSGCQVLEKAFVNKGGKTSDFKELYLRCSIQDYYIKFCESKVSLKKMKKYIDKGVTVTYEVKDGEWDICEGDPEMQSRVGTYAVILEIKKQKKVRAKF